MSGAEWAIKVDSVSKAFRVHLEKNNTLKEKFIYAGRAKHRDFVALQNVSLTIPRGTTVGLLGVNGSGKSTLLKLISRILYPDTGTIQVRGKVSSLLELGAGFHPDFTGKENIYLNGSLMGLSKKEIQRKIDEIVDFSELGDFIREPIRSYSSGMYMRLAFAVAVAVDPEVLLIDEILAVGDAAFQAKCMDRLRWLQGQNRTIVIVTHDTGAIERFCDRAVWLNNSRLVMDGDPSECVQLYLQEAFHSAKEGASIMTFDRDQAATYIEVPDHSRQKTSVEDRIGIHDVFFESITVSSELGEELVRSGEHLQVLMNIGCRSGRSDVIFGISIETEDDVLIYGTDTKTDMTGVKHIPRSERSCVVIEFERLFLSPGNYHINAKIMTEAGEPLDIWPRCATLTVVAESREVGYIRLEHAWKFSLLDGSTL